MQGNILEPQEWDFPSSASFFFIFHEDEIYLSIFNENNMDFIIGWWSVYGSSTKYWGKVQVQPMRQ